MNWYLRKSGIVSGPFAEEEIRRRLSLNLLTSMDEVSPDGRSWRRIRQTPLWQPVPAAPSRGKAPLTPAALHQKRIAVGKALAGGAAASGSVSAAPPPFPAAGTGQRERGRFRNWWLAVAIPCATLVVLALIGLFVPGGGDAIPPDGDDGYRGEEIEPIDYSIIAPKYHDWVHYITPSYADVRQMFQMVLNSEHVSSNPLYEMLTKDTRLYLISQNDTVNAFASAEDVFRKEEWHTMYVMGGYGRFARVIGAVLAMENRNPDSDGERLDTLLGQLATVITEKQGGLSIEDADSILAQCGGSYDLFSDEGFVAEAKAASRGILMSVIAHEVGHLALGHVHTGSRTLERNRNQEREADSFAHSVASGGADADSMFLGNFFSDFIFSLLEESGDTDLSRTHPYSEERLYNLIRDNRSIASRYGITEDDMREMLREARSSLR